MPYGFKIEYTDPADGQVADITDKISRFTITASLQNYCREMTLEIADPDFYASLPLTRIPAAPSIEIYTRTADTWYSQGRFYIERPAMTHEVNNSLARSVWGRSETSALGEPFASKRSISVESDTTFFTLAESLVTGAGLSWDLANSQINDYPVYAYTYARENSYPIDILSELTEFAGAVVSTDRLGNVRILQKEYSPVAADVTIDGAEISRVSEDPEWPNFGNRIRITPAGDLAGFRVAVTVPDPCMPADGSSSRRVYARLTDADGQPVQNTPIDWQTGAQYASLATVRNNTGTRLMPGEEVRAKNYHDIEVTFPPSTVRGVWAYADKTRKTDLAAAGYETSGHTITLTAPLKYCDQLLIVEYFSQGVAINRVKAGAQAEDVKVTASIQGAVASGEFYIGNACQCPPSIDLEALPSRIQINESAALIIYAEESGPVADGRMVYLTHTNETALGTLSWGRARLGRVKINYERTAAKNEVAGVTQAEVSRYINSVTGAWRADGNGNALGGNIYAGSFSDKTVDLSVSLESGAALVVTYTAEGAALAGFTAGGEPGTANFRTWMRSNREAPVEDTESLRIEDPSDPYGDNPGTDYGGTGGDGDDGGLEPPETGFCTDENGDLVKCADNEMCCFDEEGNIGCRPEEECASSGLYECVSDNLSVEPDMEPAQRFTDALNTGCTCEEICRQELDKYGTTQNFDDYSYRTIGQIAEEDYGLEPGSPDYNEKTADLEQQALDRCIAQCDECGDVEALTANDGGTMDPPGSKTISITGGVGPFTWSLSGVSGSLEAEQTNGRDNVLNVDDSEACGSAVITVTDICDQTCEVGVRMAGGQWVETDRKDCPARGSATEDNGNLIKGRWKIAESLAGEDGYVGGASGSCNQDCMDWLESVAADFENGGCYTWSSQIGTCNSEVGCEIENPCISENYHQLVVWNLCADWPCGGVNFYCLGGRTVYEWTCPTE